MLLFLVHRLDWKVLLGLKHPLPHSAVSGSSAIPYKQRRLRKYIEWWGKYIFRYLYLVMFVLVQPPSDCAEDDVTTVGYLSNGEQISLATQLILRKIEDSWWACNRLLPGKLISLKHHLALWFERSLSYNYAIILIFQKYGANDLAYRC